MNSVWKQNSRLPEFPRLAHDIACDVLIIGGGMAGLLTAYLLHKSGVNYVLVEKDRIAGGTTGNTTAKVTYQHGLCYSKLLSSRGLETAKLYLQANKTAFERLCELCRDVDCDFETRDNYVYSVSARKKLEEEINALKSLGFKAELCDRLPLPVKTVGAVKFSNQAQFHPLKFLSQIVKGLNIYEHTFVREMIGIKAVTENAQISAKDVIVTTHFPFINKHGSYFLKLYQHRSYVIALKNAQDVGGMYVDECKTGMSFRNSGELLLLGGGGHRTGKQGGNWQELRDFAADVYPNAAETAFWATQDCMSLDSVPYIGHYSKNTPHLYTASGFNKWGMTGSMLSAMLLNDYITGKTLPDYAEVFSPSRSILKPQLAVNGFEAATNLLKFTNKRCPHLGCALKWNSAEHSWDCPCHGSRFSEDGELLDNPANGNIKI